MLILTTIEDNKGDSKKCAQNMHRIVDKVWKMTIYAPLQVLRKRKSVILPFIVVVTSIKLSIVGVRRASKANVNDVYRRMFGVSVWHKRDNHQLVTHITRYLYYLTINNNNNIHRHIHIRCNELGK
jgi:hypothetical protein